MTYDNALIDTASSTTIANQDNDAVKNNKSKPESGGWNGISLTGDQISPNNFTHNNMQPFFGSTVKQNVDEYATRGIFENFTGDMDSYQKKQEQGLFFEPQRNVSNVYGASNLDGYQLDRYYVSNVRSNETPVEKVYVGPGLNQGYTATPNGGFQQADTLDYVRPKTVDEMRVKTKPKISYFGRIVSGAHVAKPGKIGTVYKNRPDTFWIEEPDRYFTTTGAVIAPESRPCQIVKYTNRNTTELKTRLNSAAPVHGSKAQVRSKYKLSSKVTYENDGPRNADANGQWSILGMLGMGNVPNDYGKGSIKIRPNTRTETGDKTTVLNAHSKVSKGEARNGQQPRRTKKVLMIGNPRQSGNATPQEKRGVVYDPTNVPRHTLKEEFENNDHNGYITGENNGYVNDPNDVARTTMKEQNIHNDHYGYMNSGEDRGVVYDPVDYQARKTMKQVTEDNDYNGNMRNTEGRGFVYDPDEYRARNTMKETYEDNDRSGNIGNQSKPYVKNNQPLKVTTKETTMAHNVMGIVNKERGDGYLYKKVDAPITNRQMQLTDYTGNTDGPSIGAYEITEMEAINTNRQFDHVEYTGNVGNTSNTAKPLSYTDMYNATMKAVRGDQDKGFTPGMAGPNTPIDPSQITANTHRNVDNVNKFIAERGVMSQPLTSSIPQMSECNLTQMKEIVPNEPLADRINPIILNAFKTNPYTQSLNSWA